ncbi:MAG: hybrid sensor histidine kinase/response regulator [Marinilabiliaceae bacterium]|nr:hybrid sensor histidine kinase/response regulator [Marinilabiliaceae bacterium]
MNVLGRHIFIVDDNLNNLQIIARILKEAGYKISLAENGKSALTQLEKYSPDLILLDVMMPEMDGYEMCRLMKQDDRYKDIPVIFLTAKNQTEDLMEGFNAGGVDYIVKPFQQDELLIRVVNHLELALAKKELIEFNQTRSKLYSIIAHDIRSPINSILFALKAINEGYFDADSTGFDDIMLQLEQTTKQTNSLLDNLLDWTKFQSSKLEMSPQLNTFVPLLQECIQLLDSYAHQKGISIELNVSDSVEGYFDELSMHVVFRNLISNAIKFTRENGKIVLTQYSRGDSIVIRIQDNGVGMDSKTLNKLFEKQESYTTLGTQKEKGTGLGLVMVKEFVEKNNGSIHVTSVSGQGTIFDISIPAMKGVKNDKLISFGSIIEENV